MKSILEIFWHGKELTVIQMCARGVLVFLITLFLIRISGRRSFGIRTPLDNIIVILLGAILSRGIAGESPFIPVVTTAFTIVLLHRFLGWLMTQNEFFSQFIEGKKIMLYQDGKFLKENMKKAILCKEDIMLGIRKTALMEDLNKIERYTLNLMEKSQQ